MAEGFEVAVLGLDPATDPDELAARVADIVAHLPTDATVTVFGPVTAAEHQHRPVKTDVGRPRSASGPLAPVMRIVFANVRSRRAWRSLRADADAIHRLRRADLVVVVDTLGHRSGWMLARKHGVRAVTGLRAVRYLSGRLAGE